MPSVLRALRALGLGALLLVAACDSPKEKEAKYVAHGKELFDGGDYVKASLEFKNALQINPAGLEAQYFLGLIAERQHDPNTAMTAFQRVADADPKNFEAHLKAGQYALLAGDADTAKHYGDDLVTIDPKRPDGHTMRAAALMMKGDLQQAEKELNTALTLDPNNVDALVVLAGRKARDNDFDAAAALVERGLKVTPDNKDLLITKLKLMSDQHRMADVQEILEKLHGIDPANPTYVIDLANVLRAVGKTADAEALYRNALSANQDSDALVSAFASFLVTTKNLDGAIADIEALVKKEQRTSKYVLLLEQLYLRAGKLDTANALMQDLEQKGQTLSDRLQAKVELARVADLKGDRKAALDLLSGVIDQDKANESALLVRGAIMLNDRKYDNAIADARSVLSQDLNSVPGLTLLAKAYSATGQSDLAIDTLRSLVRLSPTDVDARLQLASLLAPKSPDDALQHLDAAIALRPDAIGLKIQKAEFLLRTGDAGKAEVIGQDLVKVSETSSAGHRIIGEAALARSDFKTAIAEFNTAGTQGDQFAEVGPLLVSAYVGAGQEAEANSLLKQRIEQNPSDAEAMALLARLQVRNGKIGDAEVTLKQAIAVPTAPSGAYTDLARLYLGRRQFDDAVKISGAAAAKFPQDHAVVLFSAIALDAAGQFDAAKTQYDTILAKWPDDGVAANNLASLIADQWPKDSGLLDQARRLAEPFRTSNDPNVVDTLGWVLYRQGNFDDSSILLERAASLAPQNQQIQYHYAAVLKAKGLTAKAKATFTQALSGNPDYRGIDEAKRAYGELK